MPPEEVRVLGVPVDNVDEDYVLEFVARSVAARKTTQIVTINAEYVMGARRDSEFRRVVEEADLHTPDGAGVVLAARRRGVPILSRVGGADLIWSICRQAAKLGQRVFLLGGAPGVSARAAGVLTARYPGLTVAGTYCGRPSPSDDDVQVSLIREASPDILFVAFGAPDQDLWISRVKERLQVPVSIGVGGAFDYVAGNAKRAPQWMQDHYLDWFWRLAHEPWRWRRMTVLPYFALLAALRHD